MKFGSLLKKALFLQKKLLRRLRPVQLLLKKVRFSGGAGADLSKTVESINMVAQKLKDISSSVVDQLGWRQR
jgi:hypothetical protein